jgi:cytochrome P450
MELNHASADTKTLPLLQACLKESMRLKPVGPIIMRKASRHDFVDGVNVQAEDQIILHLAAMNLYKVDNAEVFDPGRFLDGDGLSWVRIENPYVRHGFGDMWHS